MASIKKRGNKWQVRVSFRDENGEFRTKSKSGFLTKKEATIFAHELEMNKENGFDIKQSDMPFADYFFEWFKTYKKDSLSKITSDRYMITHREIKKYFKDKPLTDIKRTDYQQFLNKYAKTHAPSTVKKINNIIGNAVRNAVYDDVIRKDITHGVTVNGNKDRVVKVDYMNVDEITKLTNYLIEHLDYRFTANYMVLTAIFTGARIGEIMGLTWKDVNLDFKTININKTLNSATGKGFKPTKNESSNRIIPISDTLVNVLKDLKNKQNGSPRELIYISHRSHNVPSSTGANKALRSAMKSLGINRSNFHFHSLRHSHVAYLLSIGVDIYAIAKRLGHSDVSTTIKTYSYLIDEYKEKNDSIITNGLDQLVQKKQNDLIKHKAN